MLAPQLKQFSAIFKLNFTTEYFGGVYSEFALSKGGVT